MTNSHLDPIERRSGHVQHIQKADVSREPEQKCFSPGPRHLIPHVKGGKVSSVAGQGYAQTCFGRFFNELLIILTTSAVLVTLYLVILQLKGHAPWPKQIGISSVDPTPPGSVPPCDFSISSSSAFDSKETLGSHSTRELHDARLEVNDANHVPPWPMVEMSYVGSNMKRHLEYLDKWAKTCKVQRDTSAVQWIGSSNVDHLTRWNNPGVAGAAFDHSVSFKYKRVPGLSPNLSLFQCRALLRGQNYEALRRAPLVQAMPASSGGKLIAPAVQPDNNLTMLAVVFPQYHAFKENNLFWGTNFTEWTNLKLAFYNPYNFQPIKHPIETYGGYYNLLDKGQRERMGRLAKHYGMQGFAYHHYWFQCNTVFMDEPLKRMLADGEPNMPFSFIWANEAWTRHWTGETGEVLQPQGYGNETCWKLHFDWLLTFFRHPKYIHVDNKPMFAIYIVPLVPELKAMLKLWRRLAKEAGLPGLHIVQCLGHKDRIVSNVVDAVMEYQPNMRKGALRKYKPTKRLHKVHYRGEYLGWDNFPRHNSELTYVVGDFDDGPIHVDARMRVKMAAARKDPNKRGTNFFLLTAWNEWGEGNILEPNNIFGYGNLNAVASAYRWSRQGEKLPKDRSVFKRLKGVMRRCRLKFDSQYYIDRIEKGMDQLQGSPQMEAKACSDWERTGFLKAREFMLVPDIAKNKAWVPSANPLCKYLTSVVLDKRVVRYYLYYAKVGEKVSNSISKNADSTGVDTVI